VTTASPQLGILVSTNGERSPSKIAQQAVRALIEEAELTPKPALVDKRGSGAHLDMSLALLHRSAQALQGMFFALACRSSGEDLSVELREDLGVLGREGEARMLDVTRGINTHRGAIWTLGLLCASAAIRGSCNSGASGVCEQAGRLAKLPDRFMPSVVSHGRLVCDLYHTRGAREEAENGFPHIVNLALPALKASRRAGATETQARLNALLAIMSELVDTCLLYRGGFVALNVAQEGARKVLEFGGTATLKGMRTLLSLSDNLICIGASPGGSADLLAAALFLEFVETDRHS
jgi:triphosphoribosyl-dephospho-CoA synthase